MLDTLQILLWTATYILIIIASIKNYSMRTISIPIIACVLNFAWELVALWNSKGFWGHILWAGLDIFIIFFALRYVSRKQYKFIILLSLIIGCLVLYFAFELPNGMLISVFIIDVIMAIAYVVEFNKMAPTFKIPIAITKLFGDLFAGLYYGIDRPFIGIMAIAVLIFNFIYFVMSLKEWYKKGTEV